MTGANRVADLCPVEQDLRVPLFADRCMQLDAILMSPLHVLKFLGGMPGDVYFVYKPMVRVAEQHQVVDVALQRFRQCGMPTRTSGLVANDMGDVSRAELGLRFVVTVQRVIAAFILTTASCFAPQAELHPVPKCS